MKSRHLVTARFVMEREQSSQASKDLENCLDGLADVERAVVSVDSEDWRLRPLAHFKTPKGDATDPVYVTCVVDVLVEPEGVEAFCGSLSAATLEAVSAHKSYLTIAPEAMHNPLSLSAPVRQKKRRKAAIQKIVRAEPACFR